MAWSPSYIKHEQHQGEPPQTYTWRKRSEYYYHHHPSYYFFSCFFILLLGAVIVLGVVALIIYLVLSPHKPRYFLQDVQINQLTITTQGSNITDPAAQQQEIPTSFYSPPAFLSLNIVVIVQVYNRNHHIGIYNNRFTVVLYFSDTVIGRTMLPSFFQHPQDSMVFQSVISLQGYPIQESVAADLSSAVARGTVPLHSLMATRVKFKFGSWEPGWHRWFYSNCNLIVGTASSAAGPHILYRNC